MCWIRSGPSISSENKHAHPSHIPVRRDKFSNRFPALYVSVEKFIYSQPETRDKMKTKLFTLVMLILTTASFAQNKDHLFTIGETNFGGYIGVNTKYSKLESNDVGFLELRGALTFDNGWGVGICASGLWYDKSLNELVSDGTYHVNSGYIGLFVEKIFNVTDDLKISTSLLMGNGFVNYLYDKEYRKDKIWTEEKIDETTYHITEPSVEIQYRISGNCWIGLNGSYRFTSEVELLGMDEDAFRNFGAGLTIKYGLF